MAIVEKSPYEALYFKSPETLSPNQKIFKTALELYEKNQYSDAIMQLKNLIIEEPDNAYAHFFLGVSLLLLDDIGASQQQLIKALQFSRHQEDDLLREKCYWYIGNISLKNNREKDAIWIFQKIVSMNGSFQAKAEDQISKVIKLKKRIED